jgi:hypothetical protein
MGKSARRVKSALAPPRFTGRRRFPATAGARAGDPFGCRFVARRPHSINEIVIVP